MGMAYKAVRELISGLRKILLALVRREQVFHRFKSDAISRPTMSDHLNL